MIKRIICLIYGHDLNLEDRRTLKDLDFGCTWRQAFCRRCNKYRSL